MKKNYALMILFALFMGVNVSASDLVGVYKLGGLTDETTAALGDISPDAMFRIMPGDETADYYMTGVAGYGCKWAVAYDESAGTLTVTDPSPYSAMFGMILYFSASSAIVVDNDAASLTFTVGADGVLTIKDDIKIVDENDPVEPEVGTYTQGLTLTKQSITAPAAADLAGDYTFTGTQLDLMGNPSPVEYSMSVSQTEGDTLSINGFMGVDNISATYLPELAMVVIQAQEVGNMTVTQGMLPSDIYFMLSDDGVWTLTTPATAASNEDGMPVASLADGTAVKGGFAVDLVGVYKLGGLTDETTAALGDISPDAMFRIMPGDEAADYYMTGVAGYGCKWAVAYDESAGTLTVTDPSPYSAMFGMILYFSASSAIVVDAESFAFAVDADGVLTIKDDIVITDMNAEVDLGTYTQGLTLTKQSITAPAVVDLAGDYTFTGTQLDLMGNPSPVEYSMSVSQTEGNTLSINGFMGVDNISATYLPELAMVEIQPQEVGNMTVTQGMLPSDIYFMLSDDGSWTLTTPATAASNEDGMPVASVADGTAVKGGSSAVRELPTGEEAVSVYGCNGFVYVVSDTPVAVQIYNAAGVQVYGSAAVSAPISLNKGYYLVRVAGNRKAVPVIL